LLTKKNFYLPRPKNPVTVFTNKRSIITSDIMEFKFLLKKLYINYQFLHNNIYNYIFNTKIINTVIIANLKFNKYEKLLILKLIVLKKLIILVNKINSKYKNILINLKKFQKIKKKFIKEYTKLDKQSFFPKIKKNKHKIYPKLIASSF
jgi:hypothetical protein